MKRIRTPKHIPRVPKGFWYFGKGLLKVRDGNNPNILATTDTSGRWLDNAGLGFSGGEAHHAHYCVRIGSRPYLLNIEAYEKTENAETCSKGS